jgi:hypothetical protein
MNLAEPLRLLIRTGRPSQPHETCGATSLYHIPIGLGRTRPRYDSLGDLDEPPEWVRNLEAGLRISQQIFFGPIPITGILVLDITAQGRVTR